MEPGRHGQRHDARWTRLLAKRRQRCERHVASWVLARLVAAARVPRQSGHVAVHPLPCPWRRVPGILAKLADLRADFTEHAVAEFPELFADQPLVRTLADLAAIFSHESQLLANIAELFTNKPQLLSDLPQLLADQPELLANQPVLFADQPQLLPDLTELFSYIPQLLPNQSQLFSNQPQLLAY